jgi:putative ABC transport system substrate-binding protein
MAKKILIATIVCVLVLAFVNYYLSMRESAEPEKVYRVGILCGLDYVIDIADSFKNEMSNLGYLEGKDIIYDLQQTNFEPIKEEQILNKFVQDKVDLITTFPTEVSILAKKVAQPSGVPVVFSFANIEDTGLVDSVSHPGGNITGVRYPGPELAISRFDILRELVPQAKRIWVPFQKDYPTVKGQLELLRSVTADTDITIIEFPVESLSALSLELDRRAVLADIGFDAILFISEPMAVTPEYFLAMAKFAANYNLPIGGAFISLQGYESLFGVIVDPLDTGRQMAYLAYKILTGSQAGNIPVVSSEAFFELNYREVRRLGLAMPEGLLSRADKIIR